MTSSLKKPAFDAVIFDIDNVLIDTRASYLEAIRWTVDIFLTSGKVPLYHPEKLKKGPHLLTPQDVEAFKLLGGFNDDWDCCYGILIYLLSLRTEPHTLQTLKNKMDIPGFVESTPERPLRVSGIVKRLGSKRAVTIERISRIFQEVYLGKDIFKIVEKKTPVYWTKRGLIKKEKLLFKKKTLDKLKAMGIKLGIATGRPRFEAIYGLKQFDIHTYFDAITTMNDVREAERHQKQSLRKPHPFSLLQTAKKIGEKNRFLYIGDLPDDIRATHDAKAFISIASVAFPHCAADPETARAELEKAGADFTIERPGDLIKLLETGNPPAGGRGFKT